MKNNIFYVYVYLDPRKSGDYNYGEYHFDYEPFYVGKGKNNRAYYHLYNSINHHNKKFKNKINKIQNELNQKPIIQIYQNMLLEQNAYNLETEMEKIIGRSDLGLGPLCNLQDAGKRNSGRNITNEFRQKMRNANLGRKQSQETIFKRIEKLKNIPRKKEIKNKISNTLKNHFVSNETKNKISKAHLGKIYSNERKKHMSESQKKRWAKRKGLMTLSF